MNWLALQANEKERFRTMKGRQPGRPTKWVSAKIHEPIEIGKPGVQFEVWSKWKRQSRKLGTLTINFGGLRWRSGNGKISRRRSWDSLNDWFNL